MSLKRSLTQLFFYPTVVIQEFKKALLGGRKNSLRVLICHDIPENSIKKFSKQLQWISASWKFVTPHEFEGMIDGRRPIIGKNILLTFDDGFKSNRFVADEVLRPMGISAIFFVVVDFIRQETMLDAHRFIAENININTNIETLSTNEINMSLEDLRYLISAGHEIGAHTMTHARLSALSDRDLNYEIVESAQALEDLLSIKINHFAYTFGDVRSFSLSAYKVAASRFRYIYTGVGGENSSKPTPICILRDSIGPSDSLALIGSLIEGVSDWYFYRQRKKLQYWKSLIS